MNSFYLPTSTSFNIVQIPSSSCCAVIASSLVVQTYSIIQRMVARCVTSVIQRLDRGVRKCTEIHGYPNFEGKNITSCKTKRFPRGPSSERNRASLRLSPHYIFKTESGLRSGSFELVLTCDSVGLFKLFVVLASLESPLMCDPSRVAA
jgi:hypothetical protein